MNSFVLLLLISTLILATVCLDCETKNDCRKYCDRSCGNPAVPRCASFFCKCRCPRIEKVPDCTSPKCLYTCGSLGSHFGDQCLDHNSCLCYHD
ncbi:unnamed protein product [Bursaphelenchus xylophilus]|uniref:(pine wood nematode) hypothetical protein n=1 Tax=Bursaphelenchus xylophilus TaxID=6326 RepID=A0A7I8WKQ3_BURXY|nr:unnamed protein product [Bursaphelenchus xylophilus]CAG9106725.1 unnamed protein product [Bursaphelenchus xylophilus]